MTISPARLASFEILLKIEKERAFSSILLPIYEEQLSAKDRALCHEITLGILRRQIYLDKIIKHFTIDKNLDPEVRIALRMGLFQLLFLDKIPSYSAINESVNLVQKAKKTSAKGLVNALLRRATRERVNLAFADEIEKISVETSHPRWLIEKWIGQFGLEETERLATANNEIPRAAFRFTRNFQHEDEETHWIYERSSWVEGCFFVERIDPYLLEMSERGEIYFQDEASQMAANAVELNDGDIFFDVCAAPGSKTTLIASADKRNADLFVAGDLYWPRVQFLKQNCLKQGIDFVNIVQYDAEKSLPFADETFDIVLLDAPCSGTGTIRHNPEIRYFLNADDFTALSKKQLAILQNASKLVTRGGKLIYSTCSLEMEENEAVCEKFLTGSEDFLQARPNVHENFVTLDGYARTFPHRDKMDGFFIAVFEKEL